MEILTDMHCHILPGVDDGPGKMKESLALLRMEKKQGIRRIIFTPHYRPGLFESSRDDVRHSFGELCGKARKAGLEMEFFLGCELHRHEDILETLKEDESFRMAGSSYVLLEFSAYDSYNTVRNYVSSLVDCGYKPVVAHVERYESIRDPDAIGTLIEAGAYIQVNADSVLGNTGWKNKRYVMKLIRNDMVHFIGSDAHDVAYRKPSAGECAAYLEKKLGHKKAMEIFSKNPGKLIRNEAVNTHW